MLFMTGCSQTEVSPDWSRQFTTRRSAWILPACPGLPSPSGPGTPARLHPVPWFLCTQTSPAALVQSTPHSGCTVCLPTWQVTAPEKSTCANTNISVELYKSASTYHMAVHAFNSLIISAPCSLYFLLHTVTQTHTLKFGTNL